MRTEFFHRAAFFCAVACSAPALAATHTIAVGPGGSFAFSPSTITIPAGDTITFQSNAAIAHNVVSDDGTTFSSGAAVAGPWTYVTPALSAGTYNFHCTVHGSFGMTGTITVQSTPVTLQEFGVE